MPFFLSKIIISEVNAIAHQEHEAKQHFIFVVVDRPGRIFTSLPQLQYCEGCSATPLEARARGFIVLVRFSSLPVRKCNCCRDAQRFEVFVTR